MRIANARNNKSVNDNGESVSGNFIKCKGRDYQPRPAFYIRDRGSII